MLLKLQTYKYSKALIPAYFPVYRGYKLTYNEGMSELLLLFSHDLKAYKNVYIFVDNTIFE